MKKNILILIALLLLAPSAFAEERAAGFVLKPLNAGEIKFDPKTRSKPALLVFWTSWCPYCAKEMPNVEAFYKKNKSRVEVIGISVDETAKPANDRIKKLKITYPNGWDFNGTVSDQYGVEGIPSLFLINSKGKIIKQASKIVEIESEFSRLK